jgi:hypothetical protein
MSRVASSSDRKYALSSRVRIWAKPEIHFILETLEIRIHLSFSAFTIRPLRENASGRIDLRVHLLYVGLQLPRFGRDEILQELADGLDHV